MGWGGGWPVVDYLVGVPRLPIGPYTETQHVAASGSSELYPLRIPKLLARSLARSIHSLPPSLTTLPTQLSAQTAHFVVAAILSLSLCSALPDSFRSRDFLQRLITKSKCGEKILEGSLNGRGDGVRKLDADHCLWFLSGACCRCFSCLIIVVVVVFFFYLPWRFPALAVPGACQLLWYVNCPETAFHVLWHVILRFLV